MPDGHCEICGVAGVIGEGIERFDYGRRIGCIPPCEPTTQPFFMHGNYRKVETDGYFDWPRWRGPWFVVRDLEDREFVTTQHVTREEADAVCPSEGRVTQRDPFKMNHDEYAYV